MPYHVQGPVSPTADHRLYLALGLLFMVRPGKKRQQEWSVRLGFCLRFSLTIGTGNVCSCQKQQNISRLS